MSLIIQKWCTGLKMKVNFLILKGNVKSTGQTEKVDSMYTDVREIFPASGGLGAGLNTICIDQSVPDSAPLCSRHLVVVQCFPIVPRLPLFQWSELPDPLCAQGWKPHALSRHSKPKRIVTESVFHKLVSSRK